MKVKANNPWSDCPHHEGLVNIGTHHLRASATGPLRKQNDPLVIFITGAGAPCAPYVKLRQRLSSFVRVLFYDRAGYDRSTLPSSVTVHGERIYARDTAQDLEKLLAEVQLEPPFLLVAHSYGGIIARSFLELHRENLEVIAGMMLVDTATELMLQLIPRIPPNELMSVARNVDWLKLTDLKRQSGMTDAEFDYAIEAQERCMKALKMEDTHVSARQLAATFQLDKNALGNKPLSVLRFNMTSDYQLLYDTGVKLGDGTEEERRVAREFIETCGLFHDQVARAQCTLSRDSTFVYYPEFGHDLPIRNAAVVAMELRKLLERL